jgi:hypothetical protein
MFNNKAVHSSELYNPDLIKDACDILMAIPEIMIKTLMNLIGHMACKRLKSKCIVDLLYNIIVNNKNIKKF